MKYLTDRHEIAMAMNFGKYPVLHINLENRPFSDIRPDSDYATGDTVRVDWGEKQGSRYEGMATRGELYIENGRYGIGYHGCCLHKAFGYTDVIEDMHNAQTPLVRAGQEVVLVEDWPSKKECTVRMMKISDRIDKNCQTVCTLEDVD